MCTTCLAEAQLTATANTLQVDEHTHTHILLSRNHSSWKKWCYLVTIHTGISSRQNRKSVLGRPECRAQVHITMERLRSAVPPGGTKQEKLTGVNTECYNGPEPARLSQLYSQLATMTAGFRDYTIISAPA